MKQVTLLNIVEYFSTTEGTEEWFELLRDSVNTFGFDSNVPLPLQGCVNCYLFCEPGEQAAYWFNEVCKRIGYER